MKNDGEHQVVSAASSFFLKDFAEMKKPFFNLLLMNRSYDDDRAWLNLFSRFKRCSDILKTDTKMELNQEKDFHFS